MDSRDFLKAHPAETCDVLCMNCSGDVPNYDYLSAMNHRAFKSGDWSSNLQVDNCADPIWFCQTHNISEFEV